MTASDLRDYLFLGPVIFVPRYTLYTGSLGDFNINFSAEKMFGNSLFQVGESDPESCNNLLSSVHTICNHTAFATVIKLNARIYYYYLLLLSFVTQLVKERETQGAYSRVTSVFPNGDIGNMTDCNNSSQRIPSQHWNWAPVIARMSVYGKIWTWADLPLP